MNSVQMCNWAKCCCGMTLCKLFRAGAEPATFIHLNFCDSLPLLGVCSDEISKALGLLSLVTPPHKFGPNYDELVVNRKADIVKAVASCVYAGPFQQMYSSKSPCPKTMVNAPRPILVVKTRNLKRPLILAQDSSLSSPAPA